MTKRFTNRLEVLRQRNLDKSESKLLDDIERFGWGVMHIREDPCVPGWAFTVGVFDTLGQAEIIVTGLKEDLAHSVLNDVAGRLRNGARISDSSRESGVLADVEVEFRTLDRKWVTQAMGWAKWFYGSDQFPVMQCVYPDLDGRFPWDNGFNESWRSRQPLLFKDAPETDVERQFWEANEKGSAYEGWVFSDPPHTGVFTTKLINEQKEPITFVSHDVSDGAWQFHGDSESGSPVLICFHHIIERDPAIKELVDLPRGWQARRSKVGDPWKRELAPPEEEDQ